MKIAFSKMWCFGRETKQAWALKQKYPKIETILLCKGILHSHEFVKESFDKILIYHSQQEAEEIIKGLEPTIWHTFADDSNDIPYMVATKSKVPYIYDMNDPLLLYFGNVNEKEKFAMENAAGFVFKFPKGILDIYRTYDYNLTAPYLEYLDYCIPPFFKSIETPQLNHLCYAGVTVPLSHGCRGGSNQHIKWLPRVLSQGYQYHLFANQLPECPEYDNLPIERIPGLDQPELQGRLSQYQYGLLIHTDEGTGYTPHFYTTANSNKISTYWESGIPIIVGTNMPWNVEIIVNRHRGGFAIDFNRLEDLREVESHIDYQWLKKNVIKAREESYNALNNVERLYLFYSEVL